MEKADVVYDWLNARFHSGAFRPFTAGQAAKGAGVSINTAKKYLRALCRVPGAMLAYGEKTCPNGIIAQSYYFTDEAKNKWK